METIIKKAIEGGYPKHPVWIFNESTEKNEISKTAVNIFILDPLFWQAIKKAKGWTEFAFLPICPHCGKKDSFGERVFSWKYYALKFHEINLTEGFESAVSWLEKLISE